MFALGVILTVTIVVFAYDMVRVLWRTTEWRRSLHRR